MALFPWEEWFYSISEKDKELQDLYNTYVDQKGKILVDGQAFDRTYRDLQNMIVANTALLVVVHQHALDVPDYKKWYKEVDGLSEPDKYDAHVFEIIEGTAEVLGMSAVFGKILWNYASKPIVSFCSAVINVFRSTSAALPATDAALIELSPYVTPLLSEGAVSTIAGNGLGEGAAAAAGAITNAAETAAAGAGQAGTATGVDAAIQTAEVVGETAAESSAVSLSSVITGATIFLTVGLDVTIGAIKGHKEEEEIERQKELINKQLQAVQKYLDRLHTVQAEMEKQMVEFMNQFKASLTTLEKSVMPLDYNFDLKTESEMLNVPLFLGAMEKAKSKYGFLSTIRLRWIDYHKKNPNNSWDEYTKVITAFAPSELTDEEINAMIEYSKAQLL